jgi:hypothetical protein
MHCLGQTWSEPVIVYNSGYNGNPDFTVDKKGTLHCVWSHRITDEYRKIYYSKSIDQGNTWTIPADISKNTDKWLDQPHIVADTNNHLHVVYDYDLMNLSQTRICYVTLEHTSWSQPVFLADDLPGSSYNRLVVDNQNKLYCFWYRGVIFYRCLEHGSWSTIIQPYSPPSGEKYGLVRVVVDNQNDLHCTGSHHYDGQTPYDDRVIYFTMTAGHWNDFMEISDNRSWWGSDLSLNAAGFPAFTWGQLRNDTTILQVGIYYSRLTADGLVDSVMLSTDATDPAISVDGNDNVHIVDNEKISKNRYFLVYYTRDEGNWSRCVLDSSKQGFIQIEMKAVKSRLFMMANRMDSVVSGLYPVSSIYFRKRDIPYSINEDRSNLSMKVYPNPFSDGVYIAFPSIPGSPETVTIRKNTGQVVFACQTGPDDADQTGFYWLGCDNSGHPLPAGVYFVTVQSGNHSNTRSVVLLRK